MKNKLLRSSQGKIRPFVIALLLIFLGLVDERLWKLGLLVMLILFIDVTIRYTRPL